MAEIVDIASTSGCDAVGGVYLAYATDASNITAVTVTSGVITGFTMAGVGQWGKLEFDDENNVAFFNETGELVGNTVRMNGEGLMQFSGISQAKITAANQAKACCSVVVIWFQNDGLKRVQGIDVAPDDSWSFSTPTGPRIVPNLNSDTGENEAIMQYNVPHQGKYGSPTTSLDGAAIEAL
ncbi:MAG: hypothetical protein KDD10_19070 [Phaeodactylibacter sp.]|nr:hypothetical protein [Phaeodactylibacter sp.]